MHNIVLSFYRTLLDILYLFRVHRLPIINLGGKGVIFALHQVNDKPQTGFKPNGILTITPAFLEQSIKKVESKGYDIISLSELPSRLSEENQAKPFAIFTFDDGYRDNFEIAYPIFKKHNLPFTIFITSDYSDHKGEIWWVALEEIIAKESLLEDPFNQGAQLPLNTTRQKYKAFDRLYWPLRNADQQHQREIIRELAGKYDYDLNALVERLIMSWDELREINKDPLVTLSAHTKSHYALARLSRSDASDEVTRGVEKMRQELASQPAHFAFPYGDKNSATKNEFALINELGFQTGVTTRKGLIYQDHKHHLTALPRVSLNGNYQKIRYVEMFLSGLPFFLYNGFQRLNLS